MKKHTYPEEVAAMRMLSDGIPFNRVEKETGIYHYRLYRLWYKYQKGGEIALMESRPSISYEEKVAIVESIVQKNVSLTSVSTERDIDYSVLKRWVKMYKESGPEALHNGRDKAMAKKKAYTEAQLDELEALRRRNEYLEAENALLKKVKALVEEREARLRATGRKPSKD